MFKFKSFSAALPFLFCFSLGHCAALPVVPALMPGPESASTSALLSLPASIHQASSSIIHSTYTHQHERRVESASQDRKGYRGKLMDFLDEELASEAARQVITCVTRGGPQILFEPAGTDGSMVPYMLRAMNVASEPVREVIMFDDYWSQIPIMTNVHWKDMLQNYESWAAAMQNTSRSVPHIPYGTPRELQKLRRWDTFGVLKEVIILCARVTVWKELLDEKRVELDKIWKDWDNAAKRLIKMSLWNAADRKSWEDDASKLEKDVVGKKTDADRHLKVQQDWGKTSIDFIRSEMEKLAPQLEGRVANLTAQRIWYAEVVNATETPLDGDDQAGFWLQRGMQKARQWEDGFGPLPQKAVKKTQAEIDKLKAMQDPWLIDETAYLMSMQALIERTSRTIGESRKMDQQMRAKGVTPTSTTVTMPEFTRQTGWDVSAKETATFARGKNPPSRS